MSRHDRNKIRWQCKTARSQVAPSRLDIAAFDRHYDDSSCLCRYEISFKSLLFQVEQYIGSLLDTKRPFHWRARSSEFGMQGEESRVSHNPISFSGLSLPPTSSTVLPSYCRITRYRRASPWALWQKPHIACGRRCIPALSLMQLIQSKITHWLPLETPISE